jgi:predicted nucleic acid-binding protein
MTFAVNNEKVDDLCLLPRDPDDSNYLNLALITKASHLVTWDQDILESTQQSIVALVEGTSWGFEICTPVDFLNLIRN